MSRERLLEIIANNFECALLAAANPILSAQDLENLALKVDDELWSLHPDRRGDYSEEHATIWMLYGIACNPNLSNDLKKKLLHHQNPVALIRFFDQMTKTEQDELPIFRDPVVRYFLGQDQAFESMSLVGLGWDDIYWDEQFDDYVAMFMPFLVGSSEEFLERSFELDSHPIRQAILYNPRSTITIRDQANAMNVDETREDELFVPSQIDMAKYAAFLGRYELIENWITTPEEFQELKRICPKYVADGIYERIADNEIGLDREQLGK